MSERTDDIRTDNDVELGENQPSEATDVPGIPTELVGNTTDIVSRDWTGVDSDTADPEFDVESVVTHKVSRSPGQGGGS